MTALLETVLLAAHLLCVNVASGGPLVAAWLDWRSTRGDTAAAKGAVYLARASLLGLVLGGLLGFIIGWMKAFTAGPNCCRSFAVRSKIELRPETALTPYIAMNRMKFVWM